MKFIIDRILNDEPSRPFDAEPSDLELLDEDSYDQPDVGDEASK